MASRKKTRRKPPQLEAETLTHFVAFDAVVRKLGGLHGIMALTGANDTTVHNWLSDGQFPARLYKLMGDWLQERGHRAPHRFWGQEDRKQAA